MDEDAVAPITSTSEGENSMRACRRNLIIVLVIVLLGFLFRIFIFPPSHKGERQIQTDKATLEIVRNFTERQQIYQQLCTEN